MVIKLNFCLDFEHFGQDFEVEVQASLEAEVWSVFCCLYSLLNPRVRCAFGNVSFYALILLLSPSGDLGIGLV